MKYAIIYGGISGAIIIAALILGTHDLESHAASEAFGYLVMLVALSLIFVGVKRFRDVECGGVIRFGRAFLVGFGIAAVAAIIYVAGWEAYLASSGRDFMAEYTQSILHGMATQGADPAAIAAKAEEMRQMGEMYRNPLFRIAITFTEILPVGLLVALVSAALLRNPKLLPARSRSS